MSEQETAPFSLIQQLIKHSFSSRPFSEKLKIVENGRPFPPLPALVTKHKEQKREYDRHFRPSQYQKTLWLAGCEVQQKLHCWPCLLFGVDKNNVWTNDGFSNLSSLSHAMSRHEKSLCHIRASLQLSSFGRTRIDYQLNQQKKISDQLHNETVRKNREMLKRIIDCVCFLAKQELPFRGHDESTDSLNKGNYMELLNLISEYDSMLSSHLNERTTSVFRGTSPLIQNDLIQCIKSVLKNAIKEEVSHSNFVSIMLDETTDAINKSQLSTVIRYVNDKGEAQERFLFFSDVSAKRSAEALCTHVVDTVKEFNLESKLVGQTYDGAAVLSGHVSGVQKRVQDIYPLAMFTHCYSHVLNLVLQQSVNGIKDCRIFFKTLSGLSAFFSLSSKRTHALKEFMEKKLPRVAPTRWNFNSRLVNTVKERKQELIMFFENIIDECEGWDAVTVSQAHGFRTFLLDFKTHFLLEVFSKIFCHTDILFNTLQKKSLDILHCTNEVTKVKQEILKQRNSFETFWETVVNEMADEPPTKRSRSNDVSEYRRLYYEVLDTLSNQICERFSKMTNFEFMALLNEGSFYSYSSDFPEKFLQNLNVSPYRKLFDFVKLKNELIALYSSDEFRNKTVHELVAYMNTHNIEAIMSEVYKLSTLILTIPSTTASVERSFSALRRINSYCRTTQSQERLSGLGMLSIEKGLLSKLRSLPEFYDNVIKEFVKQKRRAEFTFR